jgi:hypothetical protein
MEELADQPDAEPWVVRAAYPDGRFDYVPEDWHGLYWDAWNILRYDRHYGAMGGQGPIPYLTISRYAEDHGIRGEDFWLFRTMMDALDSEWLKNVAERDKANDKQREERGKETEYGR